MVLGVSGFLSTRLNCASYSHDFVFLDQEALFVWLNYWLCSLQICHIVKLSGFPTPLSVCENLVTSLRRLTVPVL